jgi:hypothetical protein
VTPLNPAGSGSPASRQVLLTGPTPTLGVHNLNNSNVVFIRPGPSQRSGNPVGQVPKGGTIRILCQVTGENVQDPSNPTTLHGNVWDKVPSGYISDLYVLTANSNAGQMSPPSQVWPCT